MLCNNNWVDFSWDGLPTRQKTENIQINIKRHARAIMDFHVASDQVASEIYDSHKNLYLGFSGGSDSEYVATCLKRNGIPFTPVIVKFNTATTQDQNYEVWYALRWCRINHVQPLIVNIDDYVTSDHEKSVFQKVKPRLLGGQCMAGFLHKFVSERGGKFISGYQIEYYPDHEQMTYLEPQLGNYRGFVIQESDCYLEAIAPDQHPWAFFYWSPEIVASFVNAWNTNQNMCDNKARIYNIAPRPKFVYPNGFFPGKQWVIRRAIADNNFGSRDCVLLGDKKELLDRLVTQ